MAWYDRVLGRQRAVKKKKNTASIRAFGQIGNPSTAALRGLLTSPNTDLYERLHKTRQLSRWMCENDSYASKYLELCSVYITGDDGIKANPYIDGANGPLTAPSQAIKKQWHNWGHEASLDKRYSFTELEQMAIQSIARDGEVFFRIIRGRQNEFGFSLQPIDPVLVDQDYTVKLPSDNTVIMGVERDRYGVPVAYHVWNRYLDDRMLGLPRVRERIPADEMIHIYDDPTGVQVRGMPWTTPALTQLVRLLEWQDDYSAGMKMAARTRLVLHNEMADDELDEDFTMSDVDDPNLNRRYYDMVGEADASNFVNTTQSQIIEVDAGKKLEALNIQLPQSGVSESAKLILQRIAAGLHVSYATLTADGSKSSFSTVRHDSIVERDIWRQRQMWFIRCFNRRVFKEWIRQAVLTGAVALPDGKSISDVQVEFNPRGFSSIDAIKDVQGYVMAIQNGLTTRTEVVAEMGGDFAENLELLAQERQLADNLGIKFPESQDQMQIEAEVTEKEANAIEAEANAEEAEASAEEALLGEKSKRQEDITNFPETGDDETITLRNSRYELPPLEYVERIKNDYPEIWEMGGNIEGNRSYSILTEIRQTEANAEELTDTQREKVREREAWAARHVKDFRIAGVVAQLKWHVVGSRGMDHIREVINEEIDKLENKSIEERVTPLPGQSEEEFLEYCMGHPTMNSEYPDDDQRFAVCQSYWLNKMKDLSEACWEGYEAIGLKPNGDPNCVPVD